MITRSSLERITSALAILLTTLLTFGFILLLANIIFEWDIFPQYFEITLYFLGGSSFILIIASVMVNIMLNISRIAAASVESADELRSISQHLEKTVKEKKTV